MEKNTTFSESNINAQASTSSLTINIYFSAQNSVTYFQSAWLSCSCAGQTQGKYVSHPIGGSTWASFTFDNIQHNEEGGMTVGWSWACDTDTTVLGVVSDSDTRKLTDINRLAKTDSVSGSNIEENFKVNYTKYVSGYTYKLRISIPHVHELEKIDYNTSGASFKLSQSSLEYIFNNYPNTNTFDLGFAIETWSGGRKVSAGNEVIITGTKVDRVGRLRVNGEWKRATPYLRVNGEWKKAIPYTRVNNEWKRGR